MRIAIASDHAGFEQKQQLVAFLKGLGHEVRDLGPDSDERVDYPDYAVPVAHAVASGEADRGVLICGTGIGMALAADKVAGVRACAITSPEFADLEWDDGRMRRWASSIGPNTLAVVERVFCDVQIKEQAYNPVMAILNLSRHYGEAQLEAACGYALERTAHPRCKFIRSALASGVAGRPVAAKRPAEQGGYVRGASYYAGGAR